MHRPEQWLERSLTCLTAAKLLLDEELYRDSMSRSYYSAYSAVTSILTAQGVAFAYGWNNPHHEQLPGLISHNTPLAPHVNGRILPLLRYLRQAREDADYRPWAFVDLVFAVNCVHSLAEVLQLLRVRNEWHN